MDVFPPPSPSGSSSVYSRPNSNPPNQPSTPLSTSTPTATAATPPTFPPSATTPDSASPVYREPLPQNVSLVSPSHRHAPSSTSSLSSQGEELASPAKEQVSPLDLPPSPTFDDTLPFVPRDLDRFPRQKSVPRLSIDSSSSVFDVQDDEVDYGYSLADGSPLHSRLASEPLIPVISSAPADHSRASSMALHPPPNRPPPLQIDSNGRAMSASLTDPKNPKTPGAKISSFFGWKVAASPGAESAGTEISDASRSPISPMPSFPPNSASSKTGAPAPVDVSKANGYFQTVRPPSLTGSTVTQTPSSKLTELENELREISSELAGSIRREMELEDLVEKLQSEAPAIEASRRTSDYFSDSGTSSTKYAIDGERRIEDIEKMRRAAEQERAQMKVELSQRWQEERLQRTASESHVLILENQVQQLRRERVNFSDLASKNRELETALEDTRRKLMEERQMKDNFEDLLTAMRVELEQLQRGQGNGVAGESETERLMGEIEALKIENAALAQLQGSRFATIAEEGTVGLARSNSAARTKGGIFSRAGGSLSRSNSTSRKDPETGESLVDRIKDMEAQRDALHQGLTRLLRRQAQQEREQRKRMRVLEVELLRAQQVGSPRRLGYEREVRNLREEVNHLRGRAQDALDQKWQCEKGLAGLKMDLDRAEQETASLRVLLQEPDVSLPEELHSNRDGFAEVLATSSSLESAYKQLQADRENAQSRQGGQTSELAASLSRTGTLASNVRQQLDNNSLLRRRLENAISKGEKEQRMSAVRINDLQSRLKELEDLLLAAQQQSEEEMAKHEDEVRQLQENHNAQLMRMKTGGRSSASQSPLIGFGVAAFGDRPPRLDKTTSGDGMALADAVQAEVLEKRVKELEKLLRDADVEMEEVIGRMNRAQIEVAELQSDRDEALRQTRKLQAEIQTERDALEALMH